jgi:hypothetical protein
MDRNHRAYRTAGMTALGDYGGHPRAYTFHDSHRKHHPTTAGVDDYVL